MLKENFVKYLEQGLKANWKGKAFTDYKGMGYTYQEASRQIIKLHLFYELAGIKKGDKIVLLGKNSSHWAISYLSVVTYGAVIVPILPDFRPVDIQQLVNHSDAMLMMVTETIYQTMDISQMPNIRGVLSLSDFSLIEARDPSYQGIIQKLESVLVARIGEDLKPEQLVFPEVPNADLAVISYTSGTTGFSKGVMLNGNSLAANLRFAQRNMRLDAGDDIVSFLPLAHTYGCAFEFLFPVSRSCHITFLTKSPSPQVIIQAFQEIRPHLILSVPLVIEKIYKSRLLPTINKGSMKVLLAIPLVNNLIYKTIRKKLEETFGGNFRELVIGGAAFNAEAEAFFRKIRFPFTVGYGMTECGPLISYSSWTTTRLSSCGKAVDTLEVTIDSPDPEKIVGEIILKGENVMLGYYKNEKATRDIIDTDGWLHTGDLGLIDKDKNIFIKGRSKSMILGPSGKNIYPEEIESFLNNMDLINESLIVEKNGKLRALIYPDYEKISQEKISDERIQEIMKKNLSDLNARVPAYMQISGYDLQKEEFEKTPKRSIKRFVYE
jgi:long-chain acyl-CoA synthetase